MINLSLLPAHMSRGRGAQGIGEERGEGGATPALKIHKVIIYILSFLYLIVVVVL